MMKDDELWLKKMKERLDDYSEPLPDNGWERLEESLPSAAPMMAAGNRKSIQLRRWAMGAAAAVLVAVSSVGLWMMQSPMIDDVNRSAEPVLAGVPDALPHEIKAGTNEKQPEPVIRQVMEQGDASINKPLVAQWAKAKESDNNEAMTTEAEYIVKKTTLAETESAVLKEANKVLEDGDKASEENITPDKNAANASAVEENDSRRARRPSGKDKLHLPVEKKTYKEGKGWSLALSVGNTGGVSSLNGNTGMMNEPGGSPAFDNKLSLASISNGVMSIPSGSDLVFEDGVPYLRESKPNIKDIKHKQPISFGVSVRKALPNNFSVETGLTYTLLASDVTYEGGLDEVDQKLHYVGIPVRANWSFVNNKSLTMYVSAGGAVEKCVYGKIDGEKNTVDPVQLSVMGAVGAQYNINKRVGIYVEPGVSYFFDDGSDVETIRKENPTNFTLQAGIRLTY